MTGALQLAARALDLISLALVLLLFPIATLCGGAASAHETWLACGLIFAAAACAFLAYALSPAAPPRALGTDTSPYHPERFRRTMAMLAVLLAGFAWFQSLDLPPALQKIASPFAARTVDRFASGLGGVEDWDQAAPRVDVTHSISLAPGATRRALVTLLAGIALFFTILLVVDVPRRAYWMVAALLVAGVIQVAFGILQAFLTDAVVQGTYPNRNYYAGLLEMVAPLAFALTIDKRSEYRKDMTRKERLIASISTTAKASWKVSLVALYVAFGAAIFLSRSRMGVIGFGIGVLGMVFYYAHGRWTKLHGKVFLGALAGVATLIALSVVLRGSPTMARFSLLVSGEDVGASTRIQVWKDAVEMFLASPVVGVGLGAFGETLQLFAESSWQAPHFQYAHCDWLNLLTDLGVVGFAIVCFGLFRCLGKLFYKREYLRTYQRGLLCGIFGGVVAMLVHSLVDFNLQVPANAFVFTGLLATGVAIADLPEPKRKLTRRRARA